MVDRVRKSMNDNGRMIIKMILKMKGLKKERGGKWVGGEGMMELGEGKLVGGFVEWIV